MKDKLELLGIQAEAYIKEHLSEKLDRDTICRALSTNRTTLSNALILRTGRTLKRFILDERIKMSKNLLLSGEENITTVAEKCGFVDSSYFSRVFREYTGMTPVSYVKSSKEPKDAVWKYSLEGETLPLIPCVHDCAIASIDSDGEYIILYFDDYLSSYDSISEIRPGANKLTIRYHLCDPWISVFRKFRHKTSQDNGYEIGYIMYDDQNEFFKKTADMKLFYLYHCIGYDTVILKLWSDSIPGEVILEMNADLVEYEWGFETEILAVIDQMKEAGVQFESGMGEDELLAAEARFGFTFPKEIAEFLSFGVPTGEGFFNYRDLSDNNLDKFKKFCSMVEDGFSFDLNNVKWFLRAMERRYGTSGVHATLDAVMNEYKTSPKLIPFYGHRCFFDGLDNMPIISYSQPCDLALYGENFEDYLKREFCGKKRRFSIHMPISSKKTGIWEACIRVEPHVVAHDHCENNRKLLENSQKCGCFYCLNIFSYEKIKNWIDESETALCPFCKIDSVIGDASGYSITKVFLTNMRDYWFSSVEADK